MSDLTPQQEETLATLKSNLHLPNGGFHKLITELGKEYQLPFQKVRTVVMTQQREVEKKIRHNYDSVTDEDLNQASWLASIKSTLTELSKDNVSVVDSVRNNPNYVKAMQALESPIESEDDRADILEWLMLAYEKEVFQPLLAMLRTTPLYWKLMMAEELNKMTEIYRQQFCDYPDHIAAAAILFELDEKARLRPLN